MTVAEAARQWGLSERRVRVLCAEGRVDGAKIKPGRGYLIPTTTPKPPDRRTAEGKATPTRFARLFAEVDHLRADLASRRPLTEVEAERLRDDFVAEYTYDSTAIEGSNLSLKHTTRVLQGITVGCQSLRDHLDAVGHRDAFLYVERLVAEGRPLTEAEIQAIHSLVLTARPTDKGVYRSVPIRVQIPPYVTPPPAQIPGLVATLLTRTLADRRHPIEKAARFHLDFERIHPFIDGNWRTGRLLLNAMLLRDGYPAVSVPYAERKRYIDCFESYEEGDAAPLVEFVATLVRRRLEFFLGFLG
jgi:Fic family protein